MFCPVCGKNIDDNEALFCPECGYALNSSAAEVKGQNVFPHDISNVWPSWKLEKQLGKGSYGVVYSAVRKDYSFESRAAIKIISIPQSTAEIDSLRSEGFDKESTRKYLKAVVDEFIGEIDVMESLKGLPNIVSVEDYTVVERTDDIGWNIYIRMELLTPFPDVLKERQLSEDEIISLGCDICTALEFCSKKNIIHRDIKPENIFINEFGSFKLGDFGIAKKLENMTGALSQKGTFNYMAPEVAKSADYDAGVDLYSLGLVLYRLLNGNKLPFIENEQQMLNPSARRISVEKRLNGEALIPPENASPEMAELILCACQYSPEKRFRSASQMKNALLSIRQGKFDEFMVFTGLKKAKNTHGYTEKKDVGYGYITESKNEHHGDIVRGMNSGHYDEVYNHNEKDNISECVVAEDDSRGKKRTGKGLYALIGILFVAVIAVFGVILGVMVTSDKKTDGSKENPGFSSVADTPSISDIRIGMILHNDANYNYDKNFIAAAEEIKDSLGLKSSQIIIKYNVNESSECYDTAQLLVEEGCDIIVGTSFGYESYLLKAAEEFPSVQFCQINGVQAHTRELDNFHNAYADIYKARYITGVGAGMKLNEMISSGKISANGAKLGFIAAFPNAEVISSYTAFYLGAKSVCPSVSMDVYFVNSWYDENKEKLGAEELISRGCVIISQYSDSMGSVNACDKAGIPNIAYNLDNSMTSPACCMMSSRINWAPYLKYITECVVSGEKISVDYSGSFSDGSVSISLDSNMLPSGAQKDFEDIIYELESGIAHVFSTSSFTSGGKNLTEYYADVDYDSEYKGDTQVIADGYFNESKYRSSPYFDIRIDGIYLINEKF